MSAHANPWSVWTEAVAARLSELGFPLSATDIVPPPKPELGDLAVPFFRLAKERGANPADLARAAADALRLAGSPVESAQAAGPYVNVRLAAGQFDAQMAALLEAGASYGTFPARGEGRILFEYANPNTHKEIHIGHLRNFATGVAYHSIWKAAGVEVKAVQFVNDQGVNVAKVLWALAHAAGKGVRTLSLADVDALLGAWPADRRTGNALGALYAESTVLLEADEEGAAEVSFIQARLEAHDPAWERLWRETRDWCLRELSAICVEMGIAFDRTAPYLESDFLDAAATIVGRLEREGIAVASQGALVVDLEDRKLGVALVRKSDGNLLYLSKDLALAEQKRRDDPDAAAAFMLTDDRQALYFRQLEAVLERMGYGRPYGHLGYGLLTLAEGAMSSRKGNVITYQSLRDAALDRARTEILARRADWPACLVEDTARKIAFGGMKFALLRQDASSVITFDLEQALAFEGMTGPYCQYAVVRLRSILQKAGGLPPASGADAPWGDAERSLALALAALPSAVEKAAGIQGGAFDPKKTQPAVLAQWCFATAQAVNAFYRDVPVLDAELPLRARRLALAAAAVRALTNGLAILTVDVPEAM